MTLPVNIFTLGSCRVSRPIRHLERSGQAVMTNRGDPYWFTHSARAALQLAEIALGGPRFSDELRPFIVETDPKDREVNYIGNEAIRRADLVVLEVSSLSSFFHDDWALNTHLVTSARKHGRCPDFLADAAKIRFTDTEVISDILRIKELFEKPVLTVDHLLYFPASGEPWKARTDITELLSEASGSQGFDFFRTADVIVPAGQGKALEDDSHYRASFEPVVATTMFERIISVLQG